jgi:hypothetical protein
MVEQLGKSIQEFIASNKTEIELNYNIVLSEASILSNIKPINEDIFYIGDWRISEKIGFWEAVYNEIITDQEDIEVVLEIKKVENENKYTVSDWYVKEFF